MKHLNLITLLLLAALQGKAQQFTLTGKITGEPDAPLFIRYTDDAGRTLTDSIAVKNDIFTFKGKVNQSSSAYLYVSNNSKYAKAGKWKNQVDFFIEPTAIEISGDIANLPGLKFKGSKLQSEYELFNDMFKPTAARMDAVQTEYLANNAEYIKISRIDKYDARLQALNQKLDSLNGILIADHKRIRKQFITANPNSIISAYELNSFKTRFSINEVIELFNSLNTPPRNSMYGKQVQQLIEEIVQNSEGKVAKMISAVDINGKQISLADFKGKYLILDFWGSWCVPCRESTPHLKQLFAKYNKLGLDVLAIAVDDKPKDWKEAILHDGTSIWHNIFENKTADGKNEITTNYAVQAFPTKILIDKNGVIIGRYVGSETPALDKKLAEIFDKVMW